MGRISQYESRNVFTFHLPAPYAEEWIECRQWVPMSDLMALMAMGEGPDSGGMARLLEVMPRLVTKWSFTDEDDKPLPVTAETLGMLSPGMWTSLVEAYLAGIASLDPKVLGAPV